MIRVCLKSDARGRIRVFACFGHAGLTVEEGGEDLLCAGVSALCGALTIGLVRVVGASVCLKEDRGLIYIEMSDGNDDDTASKAQVLLETAAQSLEELAAYNVGFIGVERFGSDDAFPEREEIFAAAAAANVEDDVCLETEGGDCPDISEGNV